MRELKIARTTETRSTCPYCSVSCGVIIHTLGDRSRNVKPTVVHVEGDRRSPDQPGHALPEGHHAQAEHRQRPPPDEGACTARRAARAWEEKSWDWAIDRIARLVKETRDEQLIEQGRRRAARINALTAMGVIGGCTDTNEINYLLVKAFRAGLGVIPIEQQARI